MWWLENLLDLNSVIYALQLDTSSSATSRAMLEAVPTEFHDFNHRLDKDGPTVLNRTFQNGAKSIAKNDVSNMIEDKLEATEALKIETNSKETVDTKVRSLTERDLTN